MKFPFLDKKPAKRQERPEVETRSTCYILVLPLDSVPVPERHALHCQLIDISLAAFYRDNNAEIDLEGHDWRMIFVLDSGSFSNQLKNAVADEYGEFMFFEQVV